jgi:hypothetical protein
MPERISLITEIFLDHTQVKMVENLIGDDAQNFIDVIYEVSLARFDRPSTFQASADRLLFQPSALFWLCRHWMTSDPHHK